MQLIVGRSFGVKNNSPATVCQTGATKSPPDTNHPPGAIAPSAPLAKRVPVVWQGDLSKSRAELLSATQFSGCLLAQVPSWKLPLHCVLVRLCCCVLVASCQRPTRAPQLRSSPPLELDRSNQLRLALFRHTQCRPAPIATPLSASR